MEIKVNDILPTNNVENKVQTEAPDDKFRFTLISRISEQELQEKLSGLMADITNQGERLKKHRDIRDMLRYRALIKSFLNETVYRSHGFSRENFLDKRGRHRVYGIVRLIDENMDKLSQELLSEEQDALAILNYVDEIRGLLMDIFL